MKPSLTASGPNQVCTWDITKLATVRKLFADTVARYGTEPGLTVHAGRGAAVKSDTLAQQRATLGVEQSFSRPRVSDDNPFERSAVQDAQVPA